MLYLVLGMCRCVRNFGITERCRMCTVRATVARFHSERNQGKGRWVCANALQSIGLMSHPFHPFDEFNCEGCPFFSYALPRGRVKSECRAYDRRPSSMRYELSTSVQTGRIEAGAFQGLCSDGYAMFVSLALLIFDNCVLHVPPTIKPPSSVVRQHVVREHHSEVGNEFLVQNMLDHGWNPFLTLRRFSVRLVPCT